MTEGKAVWLESRRLSADEISAQADLRLLYAQRESFCKGNWEVLALSLIHIYKFGLTRERVRQIKEKAIRRLRQSNRSKLLKSYLG